MSWPYPRNTSIRSQRAFLGAIVATIVDLYGRDEESGQQFLTDLQFHMQHLAQMFPEAYRTEREGLEALYSHLLQWFQAWSDKLSSLTPEEWESGLRGRSIWKDIYRTLDES